MNKTAHNNQRGAEALPSARGGTLAARVLAFLLALLAAAAAVVALLVVASLGGAFLLDTARAAIGLHDSDVAGAVWGSIRGWHLLCVPVAILSGVGARALIRKASQAP